MFLVDADNPGMRVERDIGTLDQGLYAGHSEVVFDGCRIGPEAVLGEVDRGFEYAQVRLAPARLTHCMRWLGLSRRAHDIAIDWAATRKSFGGLLGDLGMVQQMVADSEIDIAASRALIRETAAVLDSGARGGNESSIAKTFVAEAVNRVVDRAVQICGALGISDDVLLSRYLREVRPFRIYDGPSEVHRWAIAKRAIGRRRREIEAGDQPRFAGMRKAAT
jgi:acyl-CoA dehydrogenase